MSVMVQQKEHLSHYWPSKYGAIYECSDPLPYAFPTCELGHDTVESNISRLKIFVGWSKAMKIFSCKI